MKWSVIFWSNTQLLSLKYFAQQRELCIFWTAKCYKDGEEADLHLPLLCLAG